MVRRRMIHLEVHQLLRQLDSLERLRAITKFGAFVNTFISLWLAEQRRTLDASPMMIRVLVVLSRAKIDQKSGRMHKSEVNQVLARHH